MSALPRSIDAAVAQLTEAREHTLELVAAISDAELARVQSPLMSPLVWDLGHIAAFEDLWLGHRLGGRPLLREDLAAVYDAFETPRADRGTLPMLDPDAARRFLDEVRERTIDVLCARGVGDGRLTAMVVRHEHQHNETMLQTMQIAGLRGPPTARAACGRVTAPAGGAARGTPPAGGAASASTAAPVARPAAAIGDGGLELVTIPGGPCTLGADEAGFAYDNERPRHRTDVRGFRIGRTPITNATFLTFVEGGGYERREWWSAEGWAWKEEYDITRPEGWTADLLQERRLDRLEPLVPDRPVIHVSWYEADAFARAHSARLPTEAEWEKAATWDPASGRASTYPWGDEFPRPGEHANLDAGAGGTIASGAHPLGASPHGCLGMIGDVWEWTSSPFLGYPGFVADPYLEYSEVFFGPRFRVLRGGSWATRPAVASGTFRNWDFPQRRQIFAGLRIARDL